MIMIRQCRGLVYQCMALLDNLEERRDIHSALQIGIKSAGRAQEVRSESHTSTCPKTPRGIREQWLVRVICCQIVHPPAKSLSKSPVFLEQDLSRSLQLCGHDQAGHAGHIAGHAESFGKVE